MTNDPSAKLRLFYNSKVQTSDKYHRPNTERSIICPIQFAFYPVSKWESNVETKDMIKGFWLFAQYTTVTYFKQKRSNIYRLMEISNSNRVNKQNTNVTLQVHHSYKVSTVCIYHEPNWKGSRQDWKATKNNSPTAVMIPLLKTWRRCFFIKSLFRSSPFFCFWGMNGLLNTE